MTVHSFPHLAQRLFNVPLAIRPEKAEIVIAALAQRIGIAQLVRLDGSVLAFDEDGSEPNGEGVAPKGYDVIDGIAVIPVCGTLVQKLGTLRPYSGMTGYDGIRQNFLTALDDGSVKAIAFDVDSPGGEVSGLFDLTDEIYAARTDKPVWSILTESAYSAAYALAAATDFIAVPRTGGTGSVGVIYLHVDFSQALDKAGFKVSILQYGARKADGHPAVALSPEARKRFQADIDTLGDLFTSKVADYRRIPVKAVRGQQAGTFMGADGVRAGLADAVMAPDAAFAALRSTLK